jgi:hypothetical protein
MTWSEPEDPPATPTPIKAAKRRKLYHREGHGGQDRRLDFKEECIPVPATTPMVCAFDEVYDDF